MTTMQTGPKGLLITGNLLAFKKDPLQFLRNAQAEYGDVVHIRFGPSKHVYLLSDPEMIKEVLMTKQASFVKAKGLQTAKAVVGEGILTSEGQTHLRQRRLIQPSFRKDRIALYGDAMVKQAEQMVSAWQDGEVRMISEDMMALTLAIINETMFGVQVVEGFEKVAHAVEVGMKYVSNKATSIIDIPSGIPTKSNVEFKEASQTLDKIIYDIIEQRRSHPDPGRHDLLSMLLAARDEEDGTGMTDQQVRDEVMTIFIAGHETTANTLAWTWYLLSQHPEAERKLHQELDSVLQGRYPAVADLEQLPYLQQVVWESMRIFPAVWVINRQAAEDVEIGGHAYKKGDTLMMSQYVMHRNSKYYEDPDRFIPERFAGDLLKRIPQFAYFPFGGGPRICIGNNFAIMEASLMIAYIASRFRLRMAPQHPPVEPEPLVTLRPKYGIQMVVEKR
ncbi:cytochrome P450 [Paenibacillus thalictri]|uniref:Cytochrome P450 n=1 Tax=Paenibacillus thalictri TaxID=2527873 RepID=A0A4Q9DRY9_9BACL|nr:cytochrome P450 [Paenibacillus thalictri]TBL77810.1 cytochrome P450 [Paenibacillus thalictri]